MSDNRSSGSSKGWENLRPWQPGQSGNPAGRAKGAPTLTTLLRKALAESGKSGRTNAEALTLAMIRHAIKGNPRYMKEIMDRIDGPIGLAQSDLPSLRDLIAEAEAADDLHDQKPTESPPE